MNGLMSLDGVWELTHTEDFPHYYTQPTHASREMLLAKVPCPIHEVLMEAGLLDDPRIGLNSLRARWVEEQHWIYRRSFDVGEEALNAAGAWLVFDCLELNATIYLNGKEVGHHENAFRPARFPVTDVIREKDNLLIVVVEAGLYATRGREVMPNMGPGQLTNRSWLRKMQHQCGWDSQMRLMNVGILGSTRLEWSNSMVVTQAAVAARLNDDRSLATIRARVTVNSVSRDDQSLQLSVRVRETGDEGQVTVIVPHDESNHDVAVDLVNPLLWWPCGAGEQNFYHVEITVAGNSTNHVIVRRTGIRHVEIDQSPHPEGGRYFVLKVNGRRIFCKGANWIPADMLYSSVTNEQTRQYIDMAVQANFNFLRVWGGGLYASPAFCDACDEAGILIWHDLAFACANYPGHDRAFVREVRSEVTWNVRERAHHPSIAVWCGNNELEMFDGDNGWSSTGPIHTHYALFHRDFPQIARREVPHCAYWISSPFSLDYSLPSDPTSGDQHEWGNGFDQDGWRCRKLVARFPNEGGFFGCSPTESLKAFLPESERRVLSHSWYHHDNAFASMGEPESQGRAYESVQRELGLDSLHMSMEEYAFASGLLQAEALTEYITNFRRRAYSSAAAVFWMYNDSWPTTNSWSIVDYYLRRKPAFHAVRRTFQPVTIVVAEEQGIVSVYGINDTDDPYEGTLRFGLFRLAGGLPVDRSMPVNLTANASTRLTSFPLSDWEAVGLRDVGAFAVLSDGLKPVAQHRLFLERFRDLRLVTPKIEVVYDGDLVSLLSSQFVWAVCLDSTGELPIADDYFDLLPGIPYSLPWNKEHGSPHAIKHGGDLIALNAFYNLYTAKS